MEKRYRFLASVAILALGIWGCSDDSVNNGGGETGGDDEKTCASDCTNCVDGVCKDHDPGEGDDPIDPPDPIVKECTPACGANYICDSGKCVPDLKNHSCSQCGDDETCVDAKCVKVEEACAKCGDATKCVGGICYALEADRPSNCLSCKENEVCRGNTCYAATDFCATCDASATCDEETKSCLAGNACSACSAEEQCVNGECVECGTMVCSGVCCNEGYVCDTVTKRCAMINEATGEPPCNGNYCASDLVCLVDKGECGRACTDGRDSCGYAHECCDDKHECSNNASSGYCRIKCETGSVLCGDAHNEVCCSGDKPVCEAGECRIACDAATSTRCGKSLEFCCDNATEVCVYNQCVKPTSKTTCATDNDCDYWSTCDVASHRCVSTDVAEKEEGACVYIPPVGAFTPKDKWHYTVPDANGIVQTPVVINLTDDNGDGKIDQNDIPDVVFIDNRYTLTALSGNDGHVLARTDASDPTKRALTFNRHNEVGAADIDNDGIVEVLAPLTRPELADSKLLAMVLKKTGDNKYEWQKKYEISPPAGTQFGLGNGGIGNTYWADYHPTIADVDGDGTPEIVTTAGIIKGNDWSKWKCTFAHNRVSTWYMSFFAVADLDQDGKMEIISQDIYDHNCNVIVNHTDTTASTTKDGVKANETYWYSAVADMMKNENDPAHPGELVPEIVRVRSGLASVWKVYKSSDGKWSQRRMWEEKQTSTVGGGNPVIADFDGDGQADIGIAGETHYSVFNGQTGRRLWSSKTQDASSNKTGSSVFDFEGDGIAEVVYRDEQYLRVYSGPGAGVDKDGDGHNDAKILLEIQNTSGTVIENPIIVDVDNDGRTEIVIVDEGKPSKGITVYSDANDNWVRTRRIWNQHAYHVTNINEDGSVPTHEEANWLNPHLNNYRANVQPTSHLAPDLVAGNFSYDNETNCNEKDHASSTIGLTATVKNQGMLGISAKIAVSFYVNDYKHTDGQTYKAYLGTAYANPPLSAGGSTTATLNWNSTGIIMVNGVATTVNIAPASYKVTFAVDDAHGDKDYISFNECKEDNNTSNAFNIEGCAFPIY